MANRKRTYTIVQAGIFCIIGLLWGYAEFGKTASVAPGDAAKKKIVYKMYTDYKRDFPGVEDISPKAALKLLQDDMIVFVDTRQAAEMRVSMLPKAISEKVFEDNPEKYAEKTVAAYCTISYRSGKFVEKMMGRGIRIYNLKGGILAWVLEGGRIYDANGETRRIHVYGKRWDFPAEGYESVW